MLRTLFKSTVDNGIYLLCKSSRRTPIQKGTVLIFRKDGLGDCIIFYPYLKQLREHFKNQRVTLVLPKVAMGLTPLLKEFDEVIEFDNAKFSASIMYRYSFIKDIFRRGFETAIYPSYSREKIVDMIMKLIGASKKIAFRNNEQRDDIYSNLVDAPPGILHETDLDNALVHYIHGSSTAPVFPTIDIRLFDPKKAILLMSANKLVQNKFCVIFPGTGGEYKRWLEERFAAVCDHLIDRGITPLIAGATSDIPRAEKIISHSSNKESIRNITGDTSIATLAHILKHSLFYFGNDTGAVHLAAALDVPAICIMGGGHFGRFFPYGNLERNRIIYDKNMTCKNDEWHCKDNLPPGKPAPCIEGITTSQALKEIDDLLQSIKTQP